MSSFSDLKSKINTWNNDDESILIGKIKVFLDNYQNNIKILSNNFNQLEKELSKVEINFNNSMNSLKNISIKKFVEHSISSNQLDLNRSSSFSTNKVDLNKKFLTKEEKEALLINKFSYSISNSLSNLNIKDLIDINKNNNNSKEVMDDDAVSVTSSKIFYNINKSSKLGIKLPFIIGQEGFFKSSSFGITDNEYLSSNNSMKVKKDSSNLLINNNNNNSDKFTDIDDKNKYSNNLNNSFLQKQTLPSIDNKDKTDKLENSNLLYQGLNNQDNNLNVSINIQGRQSCIKVEDTDIIIINNDDQNANIPKVPLNIKPILKKKESKKNIIISDIKDNNSIENKSEEKHDDFKEQLLKKVNLINRSNTVVNKNNSFNTNINQISNDNKNLNFLNNNSNSYIKPPIEVNTITNKNNFFLGNDDEDDDDDSGPLFYKRSKTLLDNKRNTNNNQQSNITNNNNLNKKKTLFDIVQEDEIIEEEEIQNNNIRNEYNEQKKKHYVLDNNILKKDNSKEKEKVYEINNNKDYQKENNKNSKHLSKARSQLLKMFDDDNSEDETTNQLNNADIKNQLSTYNDINQKSKMLNSKLNNILTQKTNDHLNLINSKNIFSKKNIRKNIFDDDDDNSYKEEEKVNNNSNTNVDSKIPYKKDIIDKNDNSNNNANNNALENTSNIQHDLNTNKQNNLNENIAISDYNIISAYEKGNKVDSNVRLSDVDKDIGKIKNLNENKINNIDNIEKNDENTIDSNTKTRMEIMKKMLSNKCPFVAKTNNIDDKNNSKHINHQIIEGSIDTNKKAEIVDIISSKPSINKKKPKKSNFKFNFDNQDNNSTNKLSNNPPNINFSKKDVISNLLDDNSDIVDVLAKNNNNNQIIKTSLKRKTLFDNSDDSLDESIKATNIIEKKSTTKKIKKFTFDDSD